MENLISESLEIGQVLEIEEEKDEVVQENESAGETEAPRELFVDIGNQQPKIIKYITMNTPFTNPITKILRRRKRKMLTMIRRNKQPRIPKIGIPLMTSSEKCYVQANHCFLMRNYRRGRRVARQIISGAVQKNWKASLCAKTGIPVDCRLAMQIKLEMMTRRLLDSANSAYQTALALSSPVHNISAEEKEIVVRGGVFLMRNLCKHRLIKRIKAREGPGGELSIYHIESTKSNQQSSRLDILLCMDYDPSDCSLSITLLRS